jgi:polar amino acid transport system permease protein
VLEDIRENFLNYEVLVDVHGLLLKGLLTTLQLAAMVVPLGLIVGLGLAVAHLVAGPRVRLGLAMWIDFFRAFPPLVLLIYVYYGVPMAGADISTWASIALAFTLNTSAYFGEIFRAGIESVPRSQWDAARALGMRWRHTFALVVLPQGVRAVLPDLVSNIVTVSQLTALAAVIAVPELLRAALVTQGTTYNATPLIAAALMYLVLLWPLIRVLNHLEQRRRPTSNIPDRR